VHANMPVGGEQSSFPAPPVTYFRVYLGHTSRVSFIGPVECVDWAVLLCLA